MFASNMHFGYQMLTYLLNIWHMLAKSISERRISQFFLFWILLKSNGILKLRNAPFFHFQKKNRKETFIEFERS